MRLLPHEQGFAGYHGENRPRPKKKRGAESTAQPSAVAVMGRAAGPALLGLLLIGGVASQVLSPSTSADETPDATLMASGGQPAFRRPLPAPTHYERRLIVLSGSEPSSAARPKHEHADQEPRRLESLIELARLDASFSSDHGAAIRALGSSDMSVRDLAFDELLQAEEEAAPAVLALLQAGLIDETAALDVQKQCVDLASTYQSEEATTALRDVLEHSDAAMRLRSLVALSARLPGEALSLALERLEDGDERVRYGAYAIIKRIPMEEAEPALLAALEAGSGIATGARVKLIGLLGRTGSRTGLRRLLDLTGTEDEVVRFAAAGALGVAGLREDEFYASAWDQLAWLVEEDPSYEVQNAALGALAQLDDERTLPVIERRLRHTDTAVRRIARSLLREITREHRTENEGVVS